MTKIKDFNKRGKQYVLTGHITAVKYEKHLRADTLSGFIQVLFYFILKLLGQIIQTFFGGQSTSETSIVRGYAKLQIKALDQKTYDVTTSAELENKQYLKEGQLVTLICSTPVGSKKCYSRVFIAHKDNEIIPAYDNHGQHAQSDFVGRLIISLPIVIIGFTMANSALGYDIALKIANSINISKLYIYALAIFLLPLIYLATRSILKSCQHISRTDYAELVQSGPLTEDFINAGPQLLAPDKLMIDRAAVEIQNAKISEISSVHETVPYKADYTKNNASERSPVTSTCSPADSIAGHIIGSADDGLKEALDFIKGYHEENYPSDLDGLVMKLIPFVVIDRNAKTNVQQSSGRSEVETTYRVGNHYEKVTDHHTWNKRSFNTVFTLMVRDEQGNQIYLPVDEYIGNNTQLGDIILVADVGYKEDELTTQYFYNINAKIYSYTRQSIEVNKPSVNLFAGFFPSIVITWFLYAAFLSDISFFKSIGPIIITITPYILMVALKTIGYILDMKDWLERKKEMSYLFDAIKIFNQKSFSNVPTRDTEKW